MGNYLAFLQQLKDPNEGRSLEDILSFPERIRSLMVRNKLKIRDQHDFTQIWGSLDIIRGIEYHHNNFLAHLQALAAKDQLSDDSMLDHETIAYLHRVGQWYFFGRSLKLLASCPKINELYLFRRKSIGHRSIDCSENDPPFEQIWQAGCFSRRTFAGKLSPNFDPTKDMSEDMDLILTPKRYQSKNMFIQYQILSNGAHATFVPQNDHLVITKEMEEAYIRLFNSRS